ncbi:hypothetical protein [Thalassospira sp.]|uniref:hypothetical protein n=1 Tax=Thalassospira sp. TaxID=1912094 RepID=UPI0025EC9E3E|nr:hypothetical protein [Thalassospira sp.]
MTTEEHPIIARFTANPANLCQHHTAASALSAKSHPNHARQQMPNSTFISLNQ